jgi:dephospho-CoA kinase
MIRRVALTGGIGTGKTYVRRRLLALGVPTIDADQLARDALAPGTPGLAAVAARFGPAVLDGQRSLDRRALAAVVFADAGARRDLEAIVHPEVRRAIDAWFSELDPTTAPYAVADIPLLYETGRDRDFPTVVVAACAPALQLARVVARDGMSEADAGQRIAAQLPIEEKAARADYVVRTDGTFAETDAQVDQLHRLLSSGEPLLLSQ